MRWLSRGRTMEILAATASTRHLSHKTLDSFGTGPAVEHLRAMLVAANLLAADVRPLARLEAVAANLISGVDGADRAVIKGWASWSDPERRKISLVKQLQDLGYAVTLRTAA
jgi:hypothetical protein